MLNPQYNDVYATGGLPEKTYVFVEQNHLSPRFAALAPGGNITVAELGFGLGLAFLATCRVWQGAATADAQLSFVSFEKHPIMPDQLATAHAELSPELHALSNSLQQYWPDVLAQPGWHVLTFSSDITLYLFHGDAAHGLADTANPLHADPAAVWFLDGHDPRKNPELWTPELLQTVYRHTVPGGTASTYSAAGHVRRALQTAGFTVSRQPGFPPKRHLLTAQK